MTTAPLKITVITPSYNQGAFIEETIISVLNQNYSNLEYIIIDGGSTDNTVEIIKKYSSKITFWLSEKDNGQSDAINKGLQKASGDIITWLNSDDVYLPGTLELIAQKFSENPKAGIVHGKSILFGNKTEEQIIGLNEKIEQYQYLSSMKFPQPSSFFSGQVLKTKFNINANLHYAMDFELVAKTILLGFEIININETLSKYRLHPSSKSSNDFVFLHEWGLIVFQLFNSFSNGKVFADKMFDLGLVKQSQYNIYTNQIQLNDNQLETIFIEHLHLQYHYHYRFHHYAVSKKISKFLKSNYPKQHKKLSLSKYDLRASIMPKFLFKLLRK